MARGSAGTDRHVVRYRPLDHAVELHLEPDWLVLERRA